MHPFINLFFYVQRRRSIHGHQKTICGSWYSPSIILVQELNSGFRLCSKLLYSLSSLTNPHTQILYLHFSNKCPLQSPLHIRWTVGLWRINHCHIGLAFLFKYFTSFRFRRYFVYIQGLNTTLSILQYTTLPSQDCSGPKFLFM